MSVWKIHGISHLSYSHVQCFRADPAAWLVKYPLRVKQPTGAAMARGSAIEAGLEKYLTDDFGCTIAEAVEFAREEFLKESENFISNIKKDPEATKEYKIHKALSNMKRFLIFYLLKKKPMCKCALSNVLNFSDGNVKNHLKIF